MKEYQDQLDQVNTLFYLIIERYKKAFILKAGNQSNENLTLYNESKNQLDRTFNDLFILESQINNSLENLDNKIKTQDDMIFDLKTKYSTDKELLDKIRDANLASYPMKREFEQWRFNGYLDIVYYVLGLLLLVFLFYKAIKGGYIIGTRTYFVSLKTAKAVTFFAAIIAGGISAYYS